MLGNVTCLPLIGAFWIHGKLPYMQSKSCSIMCIMFTNTLSGIQASRMKEVKAEVLQKIKASSRHKKRIKYRMNLLDI